MRVTSIGIKRVRELSCGGEHSAILFDDNDVATVGKSNSFCYCPNEWLR
jgi:alpha-tubulin suppressor-like RCC1 family protein